MTTPHRIRLRDFWTVTPLDGGRERRARRFGQPRTTDTTESVWLVGEAVPVAASVWVNGMALGSVAAGQPFAFEVTPLLRPRNEVAIDLAAATDATLGEVAVEIRS